MLLFIIYLAFISLGLPDSLLGSAWPAIYIDFGVPVSFMGIIFMIISIGTVISSLESDRLTTLLGTGKVVVFSITLTCIGLFGFSLCRRMWQMCLLSVPYGLGAGSIDAALNNYVALHYKSRHMNWLHCMWGIGASTGPYIMGLCMLEGSTWSAGYRVIGTIQAVLTVIMILSLPLWNRQAIRSGYAQESRQSDTEDSSSDKTVLSLREVIAIPGVRAVMVTFFCYCALEQTAGQWAASYLTLLRGVPAAAAAGYASLFYIGITMGRMAGGFLTFYLNDRQMVRLGQGIIAAGILLLILPLQQEAALAGLIITGLGCAPVYPSLIHATPDHFGAGHSQAVIGIQMASAYLGTTIMPPLFGLIASRTSFLLLPLCLLILLILMISMHERLIRIRKAACRQ